MSTTIQLSAQGTSLAAEVRYYLIRRQALAGEIWPAAPGVSAAPGAPVAWPVVRLRLPSGEIRLSRSVYLPSLAAAPARPVRRRRPRISLFGRVAML